MGFQAMLLEQKSCVINLLLCNLLENKQVTPRSKVKPDFNLSVENQSLTGIGISSPHSSIPSVIPFCSKDHYLTSAAVNHNKSDPDFRSTETRSLIDDAIVLQIALLI
ncbi:unnamed protein product [Rodentolepis nana]|uniref:Ovule protein n=1 Tax=Rodentolepis nana TaxID=102285 RepID=A0A0R3TQ29_RODNA|nr:unnamed protein product [Rodentolepis nana]